MTRVGNGAFPTELNNEIGERLRTIGHEYGATTGRARRCGWLDLVLLKYAIAINGITELALTKLDVLDQFDEIKVCTGYTVDGKVLKDFPTDHETLCKVVPQYRTFKGWKTSNSKAKSFNEMHANARAYIEFIEEFLETPITFVSVSPKRDETVFR